MGCKNSKTATPRRHEAHALANDQKQSTAAIQKLIGATISPQQAKKHMFFAYAIRNESDVLPAEKLKNCFIQRRLRVYCPADTDDINTNIANGIENAAVVLVFSSPSIQESKTTSKLLNYADQTKTPILNIKIYEDFQPTDWLGAILAPTNSCSNDFDEVMKALISMGIKTDVLVVGRHEKNESQPIEKYLFYGGTKLGNVIGGYCYSGKEFPMEFEFSGLGHGKIFGQGDDEVGAFTLAGQYDLKDGYGTINMQKQYIGQHSVMYRGNMSFNGIKCLIKGQWEIDDMHDKFSIQLILSQPYTTETGTIPSTKDSRRQGSKVIISYCPCQYDLAQKIVEGLNAKDIPAVCPPLRLHEMIKTAMEEAGVIVPLMSHAYEGSSIAKYLLSYADEAGIPIVPVKEQIDYSQSGWLGVICAGALWTRITDVNDLEKNLDSLITQLYPYIGGHLHEGQPLDTLVDGTLVDGYYIYEGQTFTMKFDMFSMINGYIAGQGDDEIGGFVISGTYGCLSDNEDFQFQFKKHYIGQHDIQYVGTIIHNESQFFLDGTWSNDDSSDQFHIEVPRKKSSGSQNGHIMLSYQWNSQQLVKRVADMLKQRNIPIWFDIAGDMKGNINTAMANGVEGAAVFISFVTADYSKSTNCQKEFTYASQLKKNIVPVLLENHETFENAWLATTIGPLEKINMQDSDQFNASFDILLQRIRDTLQMKKNEKSYPSGVLTRFEGGAVEGQYAYDNQAFDMFFDYFSLREGRVSGQGNDSIGPFTMAGKYDNAGNISFIKQYVGQHAIEYDGHLHCDDLGGFTIQGKWDNGDLTDDFCLKSGSIQSAS